MYELETSYVDRFCFADILLLCFLLTYCCCFVSVNQTHCEVALALEEKIRYLRGKCWAGCNTAHCSAMRSCRIGLGIYISSFTH